jgi:hypothetical protein
MNSARWVFPTPLVLLAFAIGQQTAEVPTLDFDGPASAGTSLKIKATAGATISVYVVSSADVLSLGTATCADSDLNNPKYVLRPIGSNGSAPTAKVPGTGTEQVSQSLTLSTPLASGDYVCLYATWSGNSHPAFKGQQVKTTSANTVKFVGSVVPGENPIVVQGAANSEVAVWQLDSSDPTTANDCTAEDRPYAKALPLSGNPPAMTFTLKSSDAQPITLASPLTTGTRVCLEATAGGNTSYSELITVIPPASSAKNTQRPVFYGKVVGGSRSVLVSGKDGDSIYVYQFDAGFNPDTYPKPPKPNKQAGNSATVPSVSDSNSNTPGATAAPGNDQSVANTADAGIQTKATTVNSSANSGGGKSCEDILAPIVGTQGGGSSSAAPAKSASNKTSTSNKNAPAKKKGKSNPAPADPAKDAKTDPSGAAGPQEAGNSANNSCPAYIENAGKPKKSSNACSTPWQVLAVAASGSSGTQYSTTLGSGTPPYTITFVQPLVTGTMLCLMELPKSSSNGNTSASSGTPNTAGGTSTAGSGGKSAAGSSGQAEGATFSANFENVVDANDWGRARATITGGAVVSNQLQSGNSTTANAYVDGEFEYAWMLPMRRKVGLSSLIDTELSATPVSTQSKTTSTTSSTSSSSGTSVTSLSQLNALSSQESARVVLGSYLPVKTTRWYHRTNWLTLAPLGKAGFDTLLNPSSGSASSSSSGTTLLTTNSFSSVYNFWAAGTRVGWEEFSESTDKAPRHISWLDITVGNYSNLPSYVCDKAKASEFTPTSTAPTYTSCYITTPATKTAKAMYTPDYSRKLVPRIGIGGFLLVPNTSVAVGVDANLGQYLRYEHIDPVSKPGNDVRLYFGYQLDLVETLKKLGLQ